MKRFRGLRGKQRECFEEIARGKVVRHNPRTLDALGEKGLIGCTCLNFMLEDPRGVLSIELPYVPAEIHQDWCTWCAENPRRVGRAIKGILRGGVVPADRWGDRPQPTDWAKATGGPADND